MAVEDERENISTFIHDTVIQDVIYLMKTAEEKEENISKETIIQELDELIFHLRELCSDIYPLMIQEMGLTNTIASMIDQTVKQHTVNISYTIDKKVENFPVKINNFILRSLKEFINNSILHGKADEITLTISYKENNCFFEVVDNGNYTQKKMMVEYILVYR
ncbi:sensor histidine kinase [Enterococcus termitis]